VQNPTGDLEGGCNPIRHPILGEIRQMRLTPLEFGLRPITMRFGGNSWALPRLGNRSQSNKEQTDPKH
jgi:hypothetical protein